MKKAITQKPTEIGVYKFIKADDTYYFSIIEGLDEDITHKEMLNQSSNSKPEAAGIILLRKNDWVVLKDYSYTLDLGMNKEHIEELTNVIGIPCSEK